MSGEDRKQQIQELSAMFHLSESICEQVLEEYKGNVDHAVDHLLTITNLGKSILPQRMSLESKKQVRNVYFNFFLFYFLESVKFQMTFFTFS
jgi:hypothetical protein